jgi:hypothetical protein
MLHLIVGSGICRQAVFAANNWKTYGTSPIACRNLCYTGFLSIIEIHFRGRALPSKRIIRTVQKNMNTDMESEAYIGLRIPEIEISYTQVTIDLREILVLEGIVCIYLARGLKGR